MSFQWIDFLEFAKSTIGKSASNYSPETPHRVAINRAYYALHCSARQYIVAAGGKPNPAENVHKYVIDYFTSAKSEKLKVSIGNTLFKMRTLRTEADYEKTMKYNCSKSSSMCVEKAEKALEHLAKL